MKRYLWANQVLLKGFGSHVERVSGRMRRNYQSVWAIDIVLREAADLRRLYPRLVHHGMTTFANPDVMRYLDAFASIDEDTTLEELIRGLGQVKRWSGRRRRPAAARPG